jgi:hypothetical protein
MYQTSAPISDRTSSRTPPTTLSRIRAVRRNRRNGYTTSLASAAAWPNFILLFLEARIVGRDTLAGRPRCHPKAGQGCIERRRDSQIRLLDGMVVCCVQAGFRRSQFYCFLDLLPPRVLAFSRRVERILDCPLADRCRPIYSYKSGIDVSFQCASPRPSWASMRSSSRAGSS